MVCSNMLRPASCTYGFGVSLSRRLPEPAAGIISVAVLKTLNDNHGISERKETVVVFFGFFVGFHQKVVAGKRSTQHQQG